MIHKNSQFKKTSEDKKLLVSANDLVIKTGDGYCYPLTKRFLYLYFYLALKRLEGQGSGFIEVDEVLALPHWERNTSASVGKQIRRHIVKMEGLGRNIIEAKQKIHGPFRLKLSPKQIQIDVPVAVLAEKLGLNRVVKLEASKEAGFYDFVDCLWQGEAAFADGHLKDALDSYRKASRASINPDQRVIAMQKAGRALMQLGDLEKARLTFQKIFEIKKLNELEEATNYAYLGLIKYRLRSLDEAERLFHKSLDVIQGKKYYRVLGDIHNGLGLIRKERNQYKEALMFHQRALEYWSLVDYFYGIQACYFNIGNIYKLWGDRLGEQSKEMKETYYQLAIDWVNRCVALCEKMGIAYETSQDHILLSSLALKTGNPDKALEYAEIAIDMAKKAGNKRDIAFAHRMLGKVYLARGAQDMAKSSFLAYLKYLRKIGLNKEYSKEREKIKKTLN